MPDPPMEEVLRRIVRKETQNAARQHAGPTVSQIREIIREELEAVEQRLGSLEKHVADGFARMDEQFTWTEEQFEWVGQRFDAVDDMELIEGLPVRNRADASSVGALDGESRAIYRIHPDLTTLTPRGG